MDELKVRRAQLEAALEAARARAKELQAQHADEERLGEREAQLEAFAAAVREGLDSLDFEGRQRLVRLLIERVVVTGEHVTIEHAVPLSGRFCRLRKNDAGRLHLCGGRGRRRVLAWLTHGPVVRGILRHLNLPEVPPPLAPARGPPQAAFWQ
ncbi:hypothetical protein ACN28E_08055 [Archangium lansingense]|uniref:hypothetical protein n=1 Tax=Archangium lansingense TaxID=2995310 RepID=UPI003B77F004